MLFGPNLEALDPSLSISQYHKQYWQVEQGLPHTYVTAINQAPDGYLLVGTDEGLARFDGLNFLPLPADPSLHLSRRWVSSLLVAGNKSIWIGTFDGQLIELRGNQTVGIHQTGGSVFDLVETSAGVVWASTRNGVFRLHRGAIKKEPGLAPPLETSWNVLATDSRENVWIVTAQGLFLHHGGSTKLYLANGGTHGDILSVRAGLANTLWLGTTAGLFSLADDASAAPVRVAGVLGPVVSILADPDGAVWSGTWGQGFYRINGNRVDRWTTRDGLSDDFIRTLTQDREGNLWIGTRSGGLGRWRETRLVPYGAAEGLAGNYATTVAADPRGDIWLGTWRGGLYRLNKGVPESQPLPVPTLYFSIRALAFDRLGHQWIGNWEGLFAFDGVRYHRFAANADSPYRRISSLLFSRDGALWIGTADHGVYRFAAGRPTEQIPPPLLPGAEITALHEDASSKIWIGTTQGLALLESGSGKSVGFVQGLPRDGIESLFEDSRHRVWASTSSGTLLVIDGPSRRVLDQQSGLPRHPLYRVLEDSAGSFWVSSPRGILELRGEAMEQVLTGKRTSLEVMTYNQDDGMRTIECHGLSQPSGWRALDGSLWFPTAKGFVQVRQAKPHSLPPPHVVLEEVSSEAGPLQFGPQIELRAGARNVEIRFAALRLSSPLKVQYRYRMTGFDPEWNAGDEGRSARYNQLPPGPHTFEVQGRDPFGEWSETTTLTLRQQPRFHQTWWFLFLLGLASTGAVAAVYRWRLHTVRSRYASVMEERNRIGREWHDTLVAGFSAISLQLEAAHSRLTDQPARTAEILEVTRKMVHHYRAEARRVIWDLRDNRPEGETLPVALANALSRATESRGIEGVVNLEGVEFELPVDLRHNVLRICQEAIANAAGHGAPSQIVVTITYAPERLTAAVHDDGRGFLPDAASGEANGHFGLMVMQERARRFGGQLVIESAPGVGTTIKASIPLKGVKTA